MKICIRCNKKTNRKHFNAKYCLPCAEKRSQRPLSNLNEAEKKVVRRLAGKKTDTEIAEKLDTSRSNVRRFARDENLSLDQNSYDKETIDKVCTFYAYNGMVKTVKKFPRIKVRSIIDRYPKSLGLPPRQIRWTPEQIVQLVKFAGLAGYNEQAKYFGRPNAFDGSIKSAAHKKFGSNLGRCVNGVPKWVAKNFVLKSCPFYIVGQLHARKDGEISIALWIDMVKHLKSDIPEHLKSAIQTMAKFQTWLHGNQPKKKIEKILRGKL